MSLLRCILLIGSLALMTASAWFVTAASRTDEEKVRDSFARIVEARLDGDFEKEREFLSRKARARRSGRVAAWLPPEILPGGKFEIRADGSAWLIFDVKPDPGYHVQQLVAEFVKEDGDWRFECSKTLRGKFKTLKPHDEPQLELAWAKGVTAPLPFPGMLNVNVLVDGRVIVSERETTQERLRETMKPLPSGHFYRWRSVAFRCDHRVPYRDAAPWLTILAESRHTPVALVVSDRPERGCRPDRNPGLNGVCIGENRLDLHPPADSVWAPKIKAVIEVGPEPIDEESGEALKALPLGQLVLVAPSPDTSWDAVIAVLAMLDAAGHEGVLLAAPGDDAFVGGVRLSDHQPLDTHPAMRRILTAKPDLTTILGTPGD